MMPARLYQTTEAESIMETIQFLILLTLVQ